MFFNIYLLIGQWTVQFLFYKETNEKETFHVKSIVAELLSTEKYVKNSMNCVKLTKMELNNVIVTVAEME